VNKAGITRRESYNFCLLEERRDGSRGLERRGGSLFLIGRRNSLSTGVLLGRGVR